jgi:hypothetical protein
MPPSARAPDLGPFPEGDRIAPAATGPAYELLTTARELKDVSPNETEALRPGGAAIALVGVALGLVALIAFVGWLLLRSPLLR